MMLKMKMPHRTLIWTLALVLMLLLAVALLAVPARADDAGVYVRGYNGELKLEDGKHYGVTSSGNYEMYFEVTESANYISWDQNTNTLTLHKISCTGNFGTFPVIRAVGDLNINLTGGMSRITPSTAAGCILVTGNLTVTAQDASSFLEVSGGAYAIQADSVSAPGLTIRAGADNSSAKIVPAYHAEKYVSFTKPETAYPLWIGGLQVTSDWLSYNSAYLTDADTQQYGSGKWAFTPGHDDIPNTLTLENYRYTGAGYEFATGEYAVLYYNGTEPLTIEYTGTNLLKQSLDIPPTRSIAIYDATIKALSLYGESDALLTLTAGKATKFSYGLHKKYGDISLSGGTLTATGGIAGTKSAGIKYDGIGPDAGTLTVIGGTVTADGGTAEESWGILCNALTVTKGAIKAKGGEATNGRSFGIESCNDAEVSGGMVNAEGGNGNCSVGIRIDTSTQSLRVTGGTVEAKGTAADSTESYGVMGYQYNSTITSCVVSGDGSLIAHGGTQAIGSAVLQPAEGMVVSAGNDETGSDTAYTNQKYVIIYKSYNLWVGGTQVTSLNKDDIPAKAGETRTGKASYDPSSYTLTLDAYTYSGEGYYFTDYDTKYDCDVSCAAALFYKGIAPLTIELVGNNSLTQIPSPSRPLDESYGMLSYVDEDKGANVTIQSQAGAGSLTLTAGKARNYSEGIFIFGDTLGGDLSISDVILSAYGCTADSSYGLEASSLTITDSTVYTIGADAQTESYGICSDNLRVNHSEVTAKAGKTVKDNGGSFGISCYATVSINGGAKVEAWSSAAEDCSIGVECDDLAVKAKSDLFAYANTEPGDADPKPAYCAGISCNSLTAVDVDSYMLPLTAVSAVAGKGTICYGIDCGSLVVNDAGVMGFANEETSCCGIGYFGRKLEANIFGQKSFVFGNCRNGQGVGIMIDKTGWLGNYLGIFDEFPMSVAMTEEEYFARLAKYDTPFPLVCVMRKYDVTFDANGGAFSDGGAQRTKGVSAWYSVISPVATEAEKPVRSGWSFAGWALDAEGTTALPDSYEITDDTIVYALWTAQGGSYYVGDSRPAAPKAADGTTNGKLTFDPANPKSGDTVTVTVTPDDGYELDSITAKDASGRDVTLTKNDDGTYSFTQGNSQVTVTATFKEKKTEIPDPLAAFTDLDPEAWYAGDVRWVLTEGIMNGMGGGIFAPGGEVSRAMVMQVLWKMEGCPVVNYAMTFSDVDQEEWYAEAVRWAASAGLANGYEDGSFRPDGAVTREELATFLYRYLQSKGLGFTGAWMFLLEFDDASEISEWADEAMHWMVMNGILNGRGENLLVPGGTATRAELAAILHRLDALLAT